MPSQAIPVRGTFVGGPDDFEGMDVDVTVTAETPLEASARA
jgi:hypothetical protein